MSSLLRNNCLVSGSETFFMGFFCPGKCLFGFCSSTSDLSEAWVHHYRLASGSCLSVIGRMLDQGSYCVLKLLIFVKTSDLSKVSYVFVLVSEEFFVCLFATRKPRPTHVWMDPGWLPVLYSPTPTTPVALVISNIQSFSIPHVLWPDKVWWVL